MNPVRFGAVHGPYQGNEASAKQKKLENRGLLVRNITASDAGDRRRTYLLTGTDVRTYAGIEATFRASQVLREAGIKAREEFHGTLRQLRNGVNWSELAAGDHQKITDWTHEIHDQSFALADELRDKANAQLARLVKKARK